MTLIELIARVAEDLNLTSSEAHSRIGRRINERYRRVASSLGLNLTSTSSLTADTTAGNPLLTISAEKVVTVRDKTANRVLKEVSLDQLRNADPDDSEFGAPTHYAVVAMGASTVTLRMYPTPADARTLDIDALVTKATLSSDDVPAIPASFLDVLTFGALADESMKMDKKQALAFERQFEQRLSELRHFIAKSAYLHQFQEANLTRDLRRGRRL